MVSVTKRPHGFMVRLEGLLKLEDLQTLSFQLRDEWAGMNKPFVLVIDARSFHLFSTDAQALFEELLEEALECGLVRVTVLAITTALAGLFCTIMVRTEVMPLYQFLDLAYEENFESEMENWLNEPFSAAS